MEIIVGSLSFFSFKLFILYVWNGCFAYMHVCVLHVSNAKEVRRGC